MFNFFMFFNAFRSILDRCGPFYYHYVNIYYDYDGDSFYFIFFFLNLVMNFNVWGQHLRPNYNSQYVRYIEAWRQIGFFSLEFDLMTTFSVRKKRMTKKILYFCHPLYLVTIDSCVALLCVFQIRLFRHTRDGNRFHSIKT